MGAARGRGEFASGECDEEDFDVVVVGVCGWLAGCWLPSLPSIQRHGSDGKELNFLVCTMAVEAMQRPKIPPRHRDPSILNSQSRSSLFVAVNDSPCVSVFQVLFHLFDAVSHYTLTIMTLHRQH